MPTPHTKRVIKDWLIILASLADDIAVALIILLVLWLLGIPITPPIIIILILFIVFFTFIMHRWVIPAYHRRRVTGAEGMIGEEGEVVEPLTPKGRVKVKDENWQAESIDGDTASGEKVQIVAIKGLMLKVRRKA